MSREFEIVKDEHRTAREEFKNKSGKKIETFNEVTLPKRADDGSAGYDFYTPRDIMLLPGESDIVFTDVKAFMEKDEILKIYIRSSFAIKKGIQLANQVGIVDSSYYENSDNDGNIGIALYNSTGKTVKIKEGEKIAQGIFQKFLTCDGDELQKEQREGGFGSSGE